MAVENRGGPRPGPQNNPNNIDISGGRGQNPKNMELKYRGMGYGTTGEVNATARAAGGVAGTVGAATRQAPVTATPAGMRGAPVVPIGAPTQFEDETIFSGSRVPGGLDFAELDLPKQPVGDPDLDTVIAYYPIMRFWANQPDTPQATKDYVRYLGTIIPQ
jgi:hypothetical protein